LDGAALNSLMLIFCWLGDNHCRVKNI